jgi:two-component system, sensor histidine kinase and response regulator
LAMADGSDHPPKVLVVDDNEQNRALAQASLEGEEMSVLLAASGEEGVALFEREHPDCVLLDVRMPGLDGFGACERIRALPGGPETPIIFLTALRDVDTFDRALRAGGDDFLTKPVRPTELIIRVQGALKLRRLGAELRDHYEVVRRQRDALMRLQLQKERLTSFVVHDLKNPVNAIDLHAQLLCRDKELSPDARESAASIRAETRHLMRLITNLLDISKSEEGQLVPNKVPIDWRTLVKEVMGAFGAQAQARNVRVEAAVGLETIRADRDLFQRVLENLVENAIRHAPRNSVVGIEDGRISGEIEIRVADGGSGVPPDQRERIFDRFVQIDSATQLASRSGRGLGLTFCKSAIEAHGGRIWVEDGNPGAVFCMRLPDDT